MKRILALFRSNLHILMIPEGGTDVVSFRARQALFVGVITCLLVGGLTAVVGGRLVFERQRDTERLAQVDSENTALRAEIDQIRSSIDMLEDSIERNATLEARALALAGIHDPINQTPMGVGGEWGEDAPMSGDLALEHLARSASVTVDSLMRIVEERGRQYTNVIDALESRKLEFDHVPSIHPVNGEGWYSSGFGHRKDPFTGRRSFHSGLDVSARAGTPIVATADGLVSFSGREGFFGYTVKIDHGNGIQTIYAHNSVNLVTKGERVRRGQVIGRVGSTGRSTGPHLHYAVRVDGEYVNPYRYILPDDEVVD